MALLPPACRSAPMRPKPTTRALPTWTARSRAGPAASAPRAGGLQRWGHPAWARLPTLPCCLLLPHWCPELCRGRGRLWSIGVGVGSVVAAGMAAGSGGGCLGEQGPSPALSEPAACPLPSCEITTREYCEFMHGYFHEEATLCSQVSGAGDVMLVAGSCIAVLMSKGFVISYQEWDVVGMGVSRKDAKRRDVPSYRLDSAAAACLPCWCGAGGNIRLEPASSEQHRSPWEKHILGRKTALQHLLGYWGCSVAPSPVPRQCWCPTPPRVPPPTTDTWHH